MLDDAEVGLLQAPPRPAGDAGKLTLRRTLSTAYSTMIYVVILLFGAAAVIVTLGVMLLGTMLAIAYQ